LFNGKDIQDWDTYLIPSVAAKNQSPIGLNKDPNNVFTISDGMLHISGQDWGGIATKESFSNYHLRFQVKWNEKKWPPRHNALRDGGLLFHCSLPYDFGSKCWMKSVELQIQEGDMGDYHNVGAGIPVMQISPAIAEGDSVQQYNPFAQFSTYDKRVYRSGNFESPYGEWNTVELVCRGADAVFIINGFVVNRLYNLFDVQKYEQVRGGRIQFQSEGSAHSLRNIELRTLETLHKPEALSSRHKEVMLKPGTEQQIQIGAEHSVEIIALELLGKGLENYTVRLPRFPYIIEKGKPMIVNVALREGISSAPPVLLKLETTQGPVSDFVISLSSAP
jgi:hypothetical protein